MENGIYSRKEFIRKCLAGTAIFSGTTLAVSACSSKRSGSKKEKSTSANPCEDLSGVSKSEIKKREKFGYVNKSTVPGSHCSNCKLYLPPNDDEDCGGCLLFDGPVEPDGYCMQYEPAS
jgi:hypothetical protein